MKAHMWLLCVLLSTPVTSVEAERGFSLLKFIISVLRTRLGAEEVNHLVFIHHHAPDPDDREAEAKFLDEVLTHWRSQKKRRAFSGNLSNFKPVKTSPPPKKKTKQSKLTSSSFTPAQPRAKRAKLESARADDDEQAEEEGEDKHEIEAADDDAPEERLKGLVWGLKVEEDAKEKAAKELRLHRADMSWPRGRRTEARGARRGPRWIRFWAPAARSTSSGHKPC